MMEESKSPNSLSKIKVLVGLGVVIALVGVMGVVSMFGVFSKVEIANLMVTNQTSNSASVIWTTDKKADVSVEVSETPDFATSIMFYDDRDVEEVGVGSYELVTGVKREIHHVTVRNLDPEKEYYFRLENNGNKTSVEEQTIATTKTVDSLKTPDPVYGVVDKTEGSKVEEGVVLMQKVSADAVSQTISTVLEEGTYSLDVANLMDVGLREEFVDTDYVQEINVIGLDGKILNAKVTVDKEMDQPVENITLGVDKTIVNTEVEVLAEDKTQCSCKFANAEKKDVYCYKLELPQFCEGNETKEYHCNAYAGQEDHKYTVKVDNNPLNCGGEAQKPAEQPKQDENGNFPETGACKGPNGNPNQCQSPQENNNCVSLGEFNHKDVKKEYSSNKCAKDEVVLKRIRQSDGVCKYEFVKCVPQQNEACYYDNNQRGSNGSAPAGSFDGSCYVISTGKDVCRKGDWCGNRSAGNCKCGNVEIAPGKQCQSDSAPVCDGQTPAVIEKPVGGETQQPAAPVAQAPSSNKVDQETSAVAQAGRIQTIAFKTGTSVLELARNDSKMGRLLQTLEGEPFERYGEYYRVRFANDTFSGWLKNDTEGLNTIAAGEEVVKVSSEAKIKLSSIREVSSTVPGNLEAGVSSGLLEIVNNNPESKSVDGANLKLESRSSEALIGVKSDSSLSPIEDSKLSEIKGKDVASLNYRAAEIQVLQGDDHTYKFVNGGKFKHRLLEFPLPESYLVPQKDYVFSENEFEFTIICAQSVPLSIIMSYRTEVYDLMIIEKSGVTYLGANMIDDDLYDDYIKTMNCPEHFEIHLENWLPKVIGIVNGELLGLKEFDWFYSIFANLDDIQLDNIEDPPSRGGTGIEVLKVDDDTYKFVNNGTTKYELLKFNGLNRLPQMQEDFTVFDEKEFEFSIVCVQSVLLNINLGGVDHPYELMIIEKSGDRSGERYVGANITKEEGNDCKNLSLDLTTWLQGAIDESIGLQNLNTIYNITVDTLVGQKEGDTKYTSELALNAGIYVEYLHLSPGGVEFKVVSDSPINAYIDNGKYSKYSDILPLEFQMQYYGSKKSFKEDGEESPVYPEVSIKLGDEVKFFLIPPILSIDAYNLMGSYVMSLYPEDFEEKFDATYLDLSSPTSSVPGIAIASENQNLLQPGKYDVAGTSVTTKEFTLTTPGQVVYFQDVNGDGVKQDNEPLYDGDVASLNIQFNKVSEVQSYEIKNGWNLVSFPILMRGEGTSNLNKASDLIKKLKESNIVATHVITYRSGKFVLYSSRTDEKGVEIKFGEDFSLLPGEGYFIRSYSTGSLLVDGNKIQNSQEIAVENGWNLVGFYNSNKLSYGGFDVLTQVSTAGITSDSLSKWEDGMYYSIISQNGKQYGNDFKVYPTQGYFLRVSNKGVGKFAPN
ncbi:fibronectin type III domain-containing protein [Candidatus Dojkabacteria bacterium]|nr:fibronectin type III domain-containing protein [Candidatus Dojkabacteria bacterium]